jgi:hypothetical protein
MSGHWRLYVTAFLFAAGLSVSPASSNPLTDLLSPAPQEAAAPARAADAAAAAAPAREACAPQPGKSTAPGRHWVYHIDGHRKCWFEANEAAVSAKKQVHHHMVKRPAIAHEEKEAELRKETVLDARAQMLSPAPVAAPGPAAPAPEVADTASTRAREPVTAVPAAPIVAQPAINALTLEHAAPHPVDVEMLLAASTVDRDTAASSMSPVTADAPSTASADKVESTSAWAGTALIALGLVLLAGALLASRALGPREELIHRA